MKRALIKTTRTGIWHFVYGKRREGPHDRLRGDVSGITGDASGITGDASGLLGDVSGLRGDVSGLRGCASGIKGDATGLKGDLDLCEITDAECLTGVDVADLVMLAEPAIVD